MADTKEPARKRTETGTNGLTAEEKAAMADYAKERRTAAKRGGRTSREDGERDIRDKLAEMTGPDRAMGERIHELVMAAAPELEPRTWYGMPAYAKGGKVVCFFQSAAKFKARYATLGFNEDALLDDGAMWPTAYALTELTAAVEKRITALVKQAVG